jgi:methylmalonyl-CoA mutase
MKEDNKLFDSFTVPGKADWEKAAAAEVGNGNGVETLEWKTEDGEVFKPVYTEEERKPLSYLSSFLFRTNGSGVNVRNWANMPTVVVADEKAANNEVMHHLQHEAEGVLFQLTNAGVDFQTLLAGIEWEHCSVSFIADDKFPVENLFEYIKARKLDPAKLTGAIFWNNVTSIGQSHGKTSLKTAGIIIKPSTPVNEIAEALISGVRLIEKQLATGGTAKDVISKIAFSIPLGPLLLTEASKLKALRNLWYQVAQVYGAKELAPSDLYLHGRSEAWINPKFQPHGNMLKGTVAAIAGITGGCDAITIIPEDVNNTVMSRIARNTSAILLEESQLGKVYDPLAGAYGIDVIVDQISKDAWKKFQDEIGK